MMSPTDASEGGRSPERNALVEQHLPLVRYVAARLRGFSSPCMDFEDLVSSGTIGLVEAVDRYDPEQGIPFRSFAVLRIRGAMIDAMRDLDPVSRSIRQRAKRLDLAGQAFAAEHGREPTRSEVCAQTGISLPDYFTTVELTHRIQVSLDAVDSGDDSSEGISLAERFVDPNAAELADRLLAQEQLAAVTAAVASLPRRDQIILSLYYIEGLTLAEMAETLELSATRVSQLKARAIERVRELLRPALNGRLAPREARSAASPSREFESRSTVWERRLSA